MSDATCGPLAGLRVIEVASIGPGPYCGMLLADMGAEVIRIERDVRGDRVLPDGNPMLRGRRRIVVDLKQPAGVDLLLRLIEQADALIEGFRPGVAERLGFGPGVALERNPRLVYGRVTGWGQEGPLAAVAGHDLNYVALSGLLHLIGPTGGKPVPPLNVVGDFGGGGLWLAFGLVCALFEARSSQRGQVVDAAMIDGIASFLAPIFRLGPQWGASEAPGANMLAGAAHYYDTYETADGKWVSIAAIEPEFYNDLVERLGLDRERFACAAFPAHGAAVRREWTALKQELAALFRTRTRDEWCQLLEGTDACFAPVLAPSDAPSHPHHVARNTYMCVDGIVQNAPGPRFSRTAPASPRSGGGSNHDADAVLALCGYTAEELAKLRSARVVP